MPPRAEGGAWHGDRVLARPEDEGGRRAGGAPPGLPPWWSGPTRRSPACWSGTTGAVAPAGQVTGCPAPSRCSPSVRGAGDGPPWP
ncbi:MAG: hypothetical protein ACLRIS_15765 [Flavonifractor plautii]